MSPHFRFVEIVQQTMAQTRLGGAKAAARGAVGGQSGGLSDQSKMEMQLSLDVQAFATQLHEQLGMPASATETLLARLKAAMVSPADAR